MAPDKKSTGKLRDELLEKRSVLAVRLDKSVHAAYAGDFDSMERGGVDRGDESVTSMEADLNRAALSRAEEELAGVNRALAKIDSGDYGLCESCGAEIQAERLAANPAAALCMNCQEMAEDDHDERDQTPSL